MQQVPGSTFTVGSESKLRTNIGGRALCRERITLTHPQSSELERLNPGTYNHTRLQTLLDMQPPSEDLLYANMVMGTCVFLQCSLIPIRSFMVL